MDAHFKVWLEGIVRQVSENPFTGKPLGTNWFREKKFGKYRAYFLIYVEFQAVFFVHLSEKKDQQTVINVIILMQEEYRAELQKLMSKP